MALHGIVLGVLVVAMSVAAALPASAVPEPDTTIESGPEDGSLQNERTPVFTFSSTESGWSFECRLYPASSEPTEFGPCSGPEDAHSETLADGRYVFEVAAVDVIGTTDPTPAQRTWTIDITPPGTGLRRGPSGWVTKNSARFTFSSESGATFECRLDGGEWKPCTSPRTYRKLKRGRHVFRVRATDRAGNVDPTPASRTWKVIRFAWPTRGSIESGHGWRSATRSFHAGVDIPAPCGQRVVAADPGRVTFSGWQSGFGNTIEIAHGRGLSTLYAHLSSRRVSVGARVSRAQRIGSVGTTGSSTGCHLHFGVRVNGNDVNPMPYLR